MCSTELSPRDRFVVPCCQHALHLECLVRSFESCRVKCPFCQIDLSTLASSPQFQQILGRRVEFDQPIPDPIHQPVVPPPPRSIWPVCCRRVGGPPDYSPLENRRMEWSPVQPGASGGSSPWTFQWVCLTCSRTFRVEDVPPLPDLSCPRCQIDSGVVRDMATGDVRRVCMSCTCLVTARRLVLEWTSVRHVSTVWLGCTHPQQTWRGDSVLVILSPHLTRKKIGSRVDLCAACLHCMVGMHAPSADLARGLSLGYFVPSSHSGCFSWKPPSTFLLTQLVLVLQSPSANASTGLATQVS